MSESERRFRLVTRADFDGVVCGTLLNELGIMSGVLFATPQDMQAGRVAVDGDDISTNLPCVPDVHLCFDHHASEVQRVGARDNLIIDPEAPSAARVVYDHYGGGGAFPEISPDLLAAVDRADAARFTEEEILVAEGWTLLNFLLDGRTGLSRIADFAIPDEVLLVDLMTYCRHTPVDEILALPDVAERVAVYFYNEEFAELQIRRCGRMDGDAVVVDLRREETIYSVNRFMVYALFPAAKVSVHLAPGERPGTTEIAVGKSILDRSLPVDVGALMLDYGGGGHTAVGTCRVDDAVADIAAQEILARLNVPA